MADATHAEEIDAGQRFGFGQNWSNFVRLISDDRIGQAEHSLKEMLQLDSLEGRSFLDVGSGSGLFSLAARRLGARVHSFDFDPASVACTKQLRDRFFRDDLQWRVEEGSALDSSYVKNLGQFDIVYSWGVLHHTGDMWKGLGNVANAVRDGGVCEIALYNSSAYSKRWTFIKQTYCRLPSLLKPVFAGMTIGPLQAIEFSNALIRLKALGYIDNIRLYKAKRGMSWWHDQIDWLGGYPYETAKPEEVFDFFSLRGFNLKKLKTCGGGTGCNEFVFEKRGVQHEVL